MAKTTRRLPAKQHPVAFTNLVNKVKADSAIQELDSHELHTLMHNESPVLVLDVREDCERKEFYIAGTKHLPRGVLERDIEAFMSPQSQDKPIVTLCSGGFRSALAAASLQDMGYGDVFSLAGGMRAYLDADFADIVELDPQYLVD